MKNQFKIVGSYILKPFANEEIYPPTPVFESNNKYFIQDAKHSDDQVYQTESAQFIEIDINAYTGFNSSYIYTKYNKEIATKLNSDPSVDFNECVYIVHYPKELICGNLRSIYSQIKERECPDYMKSLVNTYKNMIEELDKKGFIVTAFKIEQFEALENTFDDNGKQKLYSKIVAYVNTQPNVIFSKSNNIETEKI